ncbi:MAG: dCTP deaminase [Candidatus Thermoplasmatota archaeon]
MSILSDIDIEKALEEENLGIKPFKKQNLTPNGYDLTIEEIYIKKNDEHVRKGEASIPPKTWFAISTREFIEMGPRISSQLWIRTTYARKGVMASFGKVDAGFHGNLTISCFNSRDEKIDIPIGDRFCQIVFENMQSIPSELYDTKSGNYHNQKGLTLEKKK